ncbi:hypothetical protein LSH36_361g08024 [Paralvinella palmiformis]|uniref:Uncharacterized protein n=1 Tax=Paralvinella palmiformis TaxID=53620 RepID=A0AAD9JE77_9ANNE|nr:hypothetical protein LSH36_361g08024 [Paralvinella palmiformis]
MAPGFPRQTASRLHRRGNPKSKADDVNRDPVSGHDPAWRTSVSVCEASPHLHITAPCAYAKLLHQPDSLAFGTRFRNDNKPKEVDR